MIEDAPGTITIIDVSGDPADAAVRNTIGFSSLDGDEAALDALGIKTYDGGVVEVETDNGDIDVTCRIPPCRRTSSPNTSPFRPTAPRPT